MFNFRYRCVGVMSHGMTSNPDDPNAPPFEVFGHHFRFVSAADDKAQPPPPLDHLVLSTKDKDSFRMGDEYELTFTLRQTREEREAQEAAIAAAPNN